LGGTLERGRGKMRGPDLGGDEDLAALHAGGAQPLPDLAFVVVHLGGVDMAIAQPQRLLDHARAGLAAQVPGAETDERNLCAVGLDGLHHSCSIAADAIGVPRTPLPSPLVGEGGAERSEAPGEGSATLLVSTYRGNRPLTRLASPLRCDARHPLPQGERVAPPLLHNTCINYP